MKRLLFCFGLVGWLAYASPGNAQVSVHVNIGLQPAWGPAGYSYVEYYYIPDIDAFYWVPEQEFVYFNGYEWIYSPYPPPGYADIDLFACYKVVINSPRPWVHYHFYADRYARYRGYRGQAVLHPDFDHRAYAERGSGDRRFQGSRGYERRGEPAAAPRQQEVQHGQPAREPHGGFHAAPQPQQQRYAPPQHNSNFSRQQGNRPPARSFSRGNQGNSNGGHRHGG